MPLPSLFALSVATAGREVEAFAAPFDFDLRPALRANGAGTYLFTSAHANSRAQTGRLGGDGNRPGNIESCDRKFDPGDTPI